MSAPTCRFDPQQMSVWSNRTGVRFLSDEQRDEAYLRATPFLLEQMGILLEDGWKQSDHKSKDETVLLDICKPRTAKKGRQRKALNLILPNTFASFLDPSKANTWRTIFENPGIFKAEAQKGANVDHDLYIGSSRPLSNIFYLLQVLSPGMLFISQKFQLDDANVKVSRMLPRAGWIGESSSMLTEVMGSTDDLLAAANDQQIAFREQRTGRPPQHREQKTVQKPSHREQKTVQQRPHREQKAVPRPPHRDNSHYGLGYRCGGNRNSGNDYALGMGGYDWAACDKDCGWCGRCQY